MADVVLCESDGRLLEDAFLKIDRVFGFPTAQKGENISRRMLVYLDHVADQINPQATIQLISGYRSPEYNRNLRNQGGTVAKTSTHMDGMAIDFTISGMNARSEWEKIRQMNCCGIGYYHGNTLHLDAGRPRFWTTETSMVRTDASEHNRFIYLSTEYDRYSAGETVRLFFTSMSDFGFGVSDKITLVDPQKPDKPKATIHLRTQSKEKKSPPCLMIQNRDQSRFLYADLAKVKSGRYQIQVSYCQKSSPLMPDSVLSNPVEIVP